MPSFRVCALAGCLVHTSAKFEDTSFTPPVTTGLSKQEIETLPGGSRANWLFRLHNKAYKATHPKTGWRGPVKTLPDGSFEQTFLSPPVPLKPGEISNEYQPVHWPEGHIAITGFTGDVVKLKPGASLEPGVWPDVEVSTRDESYYHHWTFNRWQMTERFWDKLANGMPFSEGDVAVGMRDAGENTGMQGPCMSGLLHFAFGGGNELRGAAPGIDYSYEMPAPYAMETDSDQMDHNGLVWLVNSHLIDVRNVTNFRGCTECVCEVTNAHHSIIAGPKYRGGLGCCHSTPVDGSTCPVSVSGEDAVMNQYFFKHTVRWEPWTSSHKHVEFVSLDVSDNGPSWGGFPVHEEFLLGHVKEKHETLHADPVSMASINSWHAGIAPPVHMCHVEYYVPECDVNDPSDNCVHVFHNSWNIPFSGEIVGSFSHFHAAAIDQSTYTKDGLVCTSPPVYDDQGGIAYIPRCLMNEVCEKAMCGTANAYSQPITLAKGDQIRVETRYQQDAQPHHGVMGYSVLMIHRTDYDNSDMVV